MHQGAECPVHVCVVCNAARTTLSRVPLNPTRPYFKICGYTNTKYELVSYQSLCLDFVHDKTFGEDDDVDDDADDGMIIY